MRWTPALAALALLASCGGEKPQDSVAAPPQAAAPTDEKAPAVEPVAPVDYASADAWLCRPDKTDACEQDLGVTAIAPDGKLVKSAVASVADPNAPIDCFYVYPTVSLDATANSDLVAGPEETEVVRQQFAPFGAACKLYAPIYRQVTVPALRQLLAGEQPATNREMAYADVKAAWDRYLAKDNNGRGVVLIGHSQGAGILSRLVASEIDGTPVQDRIVSAMLIGTNLSMGTAHDGGGSFKEIGLCVSNEDINCAISYVSFRADAPPPEDSLFGTAPEHGMHAACVNPAELDGSDGALKAMLPAHKVVESMAPPGPWTTDNPVIGTPFVSVPGLLSAKCVSQGPFNYLAITIHADPADNRADTIPGDVVVDGKVQPEWGLHLVDMNLALGNLVDIVKSQARSYRSREISRVQHPRDDN